MMKTKVAILCAGLLILVTGSVLAQANFATSLHATRKGKEEAYKAENGGFELITGIPMSNLGCQKCHSSTGVNAAGQEIDPATYEPNCNDCHDAQFNVQEETCLNCHSRQKLERAKYPGVDVHTAAGMTCLSCHEAAELHGDDGVEYLSLKEPGAIKVQCEDCHPDLPESPSHVIHSDTVDCAACHTVAEVNCVSCHFESLTQGQMSRPNNQIEGYKLLVMKAQKVHVGALMTHTFDGQTNIILSSYHSHVITKDASGCGDCHFNYGGTNLAIGEYNDEGTITVNNWNPDTKKIDGPQGVVPIPNDWEDSLLFDFAVYTGDPGEATDPQAWEFLKTGFDNGHLFYAEPLDAEAMKALGMVVPSQAPDVVDQFYIPFLADGVAGNIQIKTALSFTNVGEDATLQLEFYDRAGALLPVMLDGEGPDSMFEVSSWKGRTYSVETSGNGSGGQLQTGYLVVRVLQDPAATMSQLDSESTGQVGGTAVFARSDDGILVTEAGVPAARPMTDFTLMLDSMGRSDTGLAVVNPGGSAEEPGATATITLTLWDLDFSEQIAQTDLMLMPGEAMGKFIWEIFRDAGAAAEVYESMQEMEASVTVSSDVAVAALVLRQNDDPNLSLQEDDVPSLTVFPVIPGRADKEAGAAARR